MKKCRISLKTLCVLAGLIASFWTLPAHSVKPIVPEKPRTAVDYHNRGHLYMLKGEYSKALNDFNIALTLNPKHASSFISRGTLHSLRGQIVMAAADFEKAIKLDPENPKAYSSRAGLYKLQGKYQLALETYNRALALDSGNEKTLEEIRLLKTILR